MRHQTLAYVVKNIKELNQIKSIPPLISVRHTLSYLVGILIEIVGMIVYLNFFCFVLTAIFLSTNHISASVLEFGDPREEFTPDLQSIKT